MKDQLFYIEISNNINTNDFVYLRKLYLPLIGPIAVTLYQYMIDISNENYQNIFNIQEISKQFQITIDELNNSIVNLEAFGLIRKYINNDNKLIIISLEKPLNIEGFNKNHLLKNHLIKKIGLNNYESIIFSKKQNNINKSDFVEITKKYQDIYLDDFNELLTDDNYSTLDLVVKTYNNHDENIENLPSSHFVKYLLKRNVSFYETQLINTLLKLGFSDSSINVLIDFSVKYNNKIICPYILKIAEDFAYRSIIAFNEVKHEISIIELAKTKKILNKDLLNQEYDSTLKIDNDSKFKSTTKEISIHDVFSDDEMEKIF